MELEFRDGMYLPVAPRFEGDIAIEPGYCTRYARMASTLGLTGDSEDSEQKIWTWAHAWNFGLEEKNKVAWKRGRDGPLDYTKLKRGQLLGIYYPETTRVGQIDERYNPALFTHMVAFVGMLVYHGEYCPVGVHNLEGEIEPINILKFLKESGSAVFEVYSPKDESLLRKQ